MASSVACTAPSGRTVQTGGLQGAVARNPAPAPNFTLTNSSGERVSIESQRGKVVMVFFGYVLCPDECPTMMANLAQAKKGLTPEEASRVTTLFVSVDTERDTSGLIDAYMKQFDPSFIGLHGTPAEIAEVSRLYSAPYEKVVGKDPVNYSVSHFTGTFVIDSKGILRELFLIGMEPSSLTSDIKILLGES